MLPSRGPIRVTIDETSSRITQCRPPAGASQVKILRRPGSQPVASSTNLPSEDLFDTHPKLSNIDDDNNLAKIKTNGNVTNEESLTEAQLDATQVTALKLHSHVHDNIFDNDKTAPQPQQHIMHIKRNPSSGSINQQQQLQNCHHQQQISSSSRINNDGASNKKLLKTYQERADEYAKARLRILGSAFPENDDTLRNADDINRILNLDVQSASSSSTSYAGNCNSVLIDEQIQRLKEINSGSTTSNLKLEDEASVVTKNDIEGDNRNFRTSNNSLTSTGCNLICRESNAE